MNKYFAADQVLLHLQHATDHCRNALKAYADHDGDLLEQHAREARVDLTWVLRGMKEIAERERFEVEAYERSLGPQR